MPRVTTMPSAKACRKRAGSVRRFLSSRVCSYSPRSIGASRPSLPLSPTINHIDPLGNPLTPRRGDLRFGSAGSAACRREPETLLGGGRAGAAREADEDRERPVGFGDVPVAKRRVDAAACRVEVEGREPQVPLDRALRAPKALNLREGNPRRDASNAPGRGHHARIRVPPGEEPEAERALQQHPPRRREDRARDLREDPLEQLVGERPAPDGKDSAQLLALRLSLPFAALPAGDVDLEPAPPEPPPQERLHHAY